MGFNLARLGVNFSPVNRKPNWATLPRTPAVMTTSMRGIKTTMELSRNPPEQRMHGFWHHTQGAGPYQYMTRIMSIGRRTSGPREKEEHPSTPGKDKAPRNLPALGHVALAGASELLAGRLFGFVLVLFTRPSVTSKRHQFGLIKRAQAPGTKRPDESETRSEDRGSPSIIENQFDDYIFNGMATE